MTTTSFLYLSLLSVSFLATPALAFFRMGAKVIVAARMDSIVSPGAVSGHLHNVVGGSRFSQTYDYDDLRKSSCTSNLVSVDFSNYWAPGLYHINKATNDFTYIPSYYTVYYLDRNGSKKEKVHAWPAGLKMVAGDPNRRTYNDANVADKAVSFVCLNYKGKSPQTVRFPSGNCPDGLRAQIVFPSCWNGKDLDSPDHKSHMAYPIDGFPDSGNCPSTHPVRLITLFYEQVFRVQLAADGGEGSWVLTNGDTTGFGFHGDFQNGWEAGENSILQRAMDECTNLSGELNDCPVLRPFLDDAGKEACQPENAIPDEDVGFRGTNVLGGNVSALPGCNPVWSGTGAKPTCSVTKANPPYVPVRGSLPAGWTTKSCVAEPSGRRALKGASKVDKIGMTPGMCADFCQSKGFKIAGVEYGEECYCDNALDGAQTAPIGDCSMECPGNPYENCGGRSRLTILERSGTIPPAITSTRITTSIRPSSTSSPVPSTKPPSTNLPSGWIDGGCVTDSPTARVLKGASSTDSSGMGRAKCIDFCSSRGFSIAGVEWSQECFCANEILGSSAASASECNMPCTGTPSESCGGSARLNIFKKSTSSTQPTQSPTWALQGCVAEPKNARALPGASLTNGKMTVEMCTSFCAGKGYSLAGVENGNECWCDNSLKSGAAVGDNARCSTKCGGNSNQSCGAGWYLNVYKLSGGRKRPQGAKQLHRRSRAHIF